MTLKSNSSNKLYIILSVLATCCILYKIYSRVVFYQNQRKQILFNFYDADLENSSYEDSLQKKYTDRRQNARKIMKMKAIIKQVNMKQKIYNLHLSSNLFHIILIQVHSNGLLLRQLLTSLKAARSIEETLLIFSHDVFDNQINKVVHSVDFCKYMQIFYPYSVQLHPNVFPGRCNGDKICEQYKSRDAVAAQKKHHWWWQMNQVFNHLNITKNYTKRTILLLQEDNVVTPDLIIIWTWLENILISQCVYCEMISLGLYTADAKMYTENSTATVKMWSEKDSSLGLAFRKSTWKLIKNWTEDFCNFNDYSWDNTLKHIGSKHLDLNYYVAAVDAPRVFRIMQCDEQDITCKQEENVKEVLDFMAQINEGLFPWSFTTQLIVSEDYYTVKPRGLFDDERDHELCMYFSKADVWY